MLAIVVPYYKIAFFDKTLKSLANQTDKRFNVYIGDDASIESPKKILEEYKGKLDFFYHRFEENLGGESLVRQWNRCITLTQDEEWIMILGDDDVLEYNVVESFYKSYNNIADSKVNLVRFASKLIDGYGKDLSETYLHPELELSTDSYFKKFQWESRSSLSEYVFKKTLYCKYKFVDYPLAWHSDDKAWLDYTNCGFIYTINSAVVNIRRSIYNISGKTDNIEQKNKARRLFFEDIIINRGYSFSKYQKKVFLLEYGVLIKEQNLITPYKVLLIFSKFLKIGAFYDSLRFMRRMYRAKFFKR